MELRSLEFYNFGPFRGLHKIDVDPSNGLESKPLILIRANNDVGKSSILKSFNFCLYGFGSKLSPAASSERSRAINRQVAFEKADKMYVKIKFAYGGDDYSIVRTVKFEKIKKFAEEPKISKHVCEISKNENSLFDQSESGYMENIEDFIENILPQEIAQFFFFDGEKIQNYAKQKPTPAITTAVEKILGIRQILNAKKDAETNLTALKTKLNDVQSEDNSIREEAKNLKIEEEVNELLFQKMSDNKATIESLDENIKRNGDIVNKVAGIKEDWEKRKSLEQDSKDFEVEKVELITERQKHNDKKLLSHLLTIRFKDINFNQNKIPSHVVKTSQWCIDQENCLCGEKITTDISKKLVEVISSEDSSKEYAEQHMFSEITKEHGKTLPSQLNEILFKISDIDNKIQINEDLVTKIKEKIGDATELEDEKIKEAKNQFDEETSQKKVLEIQMEKDKEKYEETKKELERQSEELTSKTDDDHVNRAQANNIRCRQVIDAYSEIIETLVERERDDIQKSMSDYFLSITNKPQVYKEVLLDDEYRIQLRVPEGIVDVWKLGASSGASAMISFAFIAALNNKAARQGPIVIDTPTGRLDPIHSENIINFWPTFGKQVMILYQPSEISNKKLDQLDDLIAYHYECKVKQNSESESYFVKFGDGE